MLDKESSIPLYKQLKNKILEEIQELKSDSKIKSEKEYSEEFKISRITIRRAIDELVRENYLIRIGGKGTFVSRKKGSLEFLQIISFTEDMQKQGYNVHSKVLDFNIIEASDEIAGILNVEKNDKLFHLNRIRYANNMPMAIQDSYIISKYCPTLMDYDFSKLSLYRTLENYYNLKLSFANYVLEARLSSDRDNSIFKLNNTIAVFILKQTTYLDNGIPIEFVESVFRSDKYSFSNIALNLNSKK